MTEESVDKLYKDIDDNKIWFEKFKEDIAKEAEAEARKQEEEAEKEKRLPKETEKEFRNSIRKARKMPQTESSQAWAGFRAEGSGSSRDAESTSASASQDPGASCTSGKKKLVLGKKKTG